MDSFYLTLPSNVKNGGNKKQGDYRTILPQSLCLPGEWECGLVEFTFPYSWTNVGDKDQLDLTSIHIAVNDDPERHGTIEVFDIPIGQYDTIEELLETINGQYAKMAKRAEKDSVKEYREKLREFERYRMQYKAIEENGEESTEKKPNIKMLSIKNRMTYLEKWLKNPKRENREKLAGAFKITYDKIIKKIRIFIKQSVVGGFALSRHLAYILGDFEMPDSAKDDYRFILSGKTEFTSLYPPDLRGGIQTLFLYSDIVKPTIIGDTMARILRTVPVQGKFGDVISRTFDRPHYVPISVNSINSIEINIKDHLNDIIRFAFGTVIVKLHFQRRRSFPY